ncbi:acyl-CoA dehydrogenase family protein [Streptomyces stelliscabiei]|uniref:acyl-CoA dehydrogenase family protein n=1 Tax=Streptomyces stelliscabiei TaxID=146820 RepID=UPI0029B29C17|nr:acyl-CoA dehydrogenase family protein [Streptomyces stelliscabiei]MDX2552172.1 acyl-CoA/acyl-ACP dehydrogenase [Streptomyces stelliscabiei]MDX2609460.1 acyl-CoA/acyl-ACP dehydrogenase [Streptomyces stelliscabiei]MDX2636663.1 acyl-CoA/acyl-ACP dehydrogenase [Streptomyces stelliscabiei]MDX2660095.1 acyl-CoA/acyl-ACP dehydrogenase [Streptomyces stelliscabiei]MDX2710872.1 acyl-CoA/acyl-ACP dehydrogenase [Streptomyces stelliscabiei]
MDARLTAEQEEIRRTVRELLLKRCGPEEVRAAVRTGEGYDAGLWSALSEQLGLPGLALPESHGGVGCSVTELALAAEELGRALAPSPLLSTSVLVAPLILALGTERQRAALLPLLTSGRLTAALVVPGTALTTALALTCDNGGAWAGGGRAGGVQARRVGDGWRLYGEAGQILDGHSAGLLLVAAHAGGYARSRTLLFLVRVPHGEAGGGGGLVRVRQTSIDETRPVARLELRHVEAELLGEEAGAADAGVPAVLAEVGDAAAAVLAAEAVGAADRVLERTVAYARQREQFGRPIGSFQAVKHRLADVYVRVRAARSAAYYAAWAAAAPPGGERAGGLALAQALDALRTAAGEGIQLHGGIGFTWEHEAQLYFKRAAGDEALFGPVHRLRGRAADMAGVFTVDGPGEQRAVRG